MCGLVAAIRRRNNIQERHLLAALRTLRHRGPDSQSIWFDHKGHVALAHARLGIMDPEGGQQPLFNEDNSLAVIVNGEFYGFEAIRAQLEKQGHVFRTRSDSEILIHLYEEHGTACLRHLRGEFAFVLWDSKNEILFAARDRYGIKPLFYSEHQGEILFASEIKALFALGVPARWNERYLHQVISFGLYAPGQTCFDGVHALEAGHFLLASPGGVRIHKYWDCDYPKKGDPSVIEDIPFARQELRQKLKAAIDVRLRSDAPVAFYLSGGIDSCAVLGLASQLRGPGLPAFTISFDRSEYDELGPATQMAELCGAQLQTLRLSSRDLADSFENALWHAEWPLLNAHAIGKFCLSRAVRDAGYKVVLTGEGSDEIFGGYAFYKQDLIMQALRRRSPEEAGELLKFLFEDNQASQGLLRLEAGPGLPSFERLIGHTPSQIAALAETWPTVQQFLAPEYVGSFSARDPAFEFLCGIDIPGQIDGRPTLHKSLYLTAKTFLPTYILALLGDRMEMAHSLEGRTPFLDHPLTEFARQLSPKLKIHDGIEKYILREAVKDLVPATIYQRRKHPFLAPPATQSARNPLREVLREQIASRAAQNLAFVQQKKLVAFIDNDLEKLSPAEQLRLEPFLMTVASLAVLQERFRVGQLS